MRCYFIRDGHIEAAKDLTVTSDADAVEQATVLFRGRAEHFTGFEVWDNSRFIYRHKNGVGDD